MNKIRITESQAKRLGLIKEGVSDTYDRNVKVSFYSHGLTLKGKEIAYINNSSTSLKFLIEIEGRSWGIKDINLSNITGPEQIEMEVEYYEGEEVREITIPLHIDWSNIKIDKMTGHGVVTVGDELEITLANDHDGNLIVGSMEITAYSL